MFYRFITTRTGATNQDAAAADTKQTANDAFDREPSKRMPTTERKDEVESLNCCSGKKEEPCTVSAEESMQRATVDEDSSEVMSHIDAPGAQRDGSGECQTVVSRHVEEIHTEIIDNPKDTAINDCSSPDGEGDSQSTVSIDVHCGQKMTNPRVSECISLPVINSQKKQTDGNSESSHDITKREDALKSLLDAMPKTFCATNYDKFARKERCQSASAIVHVRPTSEGQSSGRLSSVKLPNDRPSSGRCPPDWPSLGWPTSDRPLSEGSTPGRPSSGRPSSGRPSLGRPSSGRPSSGRLSSGKPSSVRRSSDRPSSGRPSSSRPSSGRPSSGRPSSGRPSSGKPSSGRPSSGRPSSGRPSSGRPSSGKSHDSHFSNRMVHRPSATMSVPDMLMKNLLLVETAQKRETIPHETIRMKEAFPLEIAQMKEVIPEKNAEKTDLCTNQNMETEEAFLTQIGLRPKHSIQRKEAFLNHYMDTNVVLHQPNADKEESFLKSSRGNNDVILEQKMGKKEKLVPHVEKKTLTEQSVERKDVLPRKHSVKKDCVVMSVKKENQRPCAGGKLKLIVNVPQESHIPCCVTLPKNQDHDKTEIVGRATHGKLAYTSVYDC